MSNLFIWLHLQWQNVRQKYKYVFSNCESDKYITYLWQLLTSFYCGTYQHVKLPWVQILNGKTNHDYNEFSFCPNDLVISSVWTIILWKFLPFRIFRKSCPNFCHHLVQYCRILKHRPIWQKMDVHTILKENVLWEDQMDVFLLLRRASLTLRKSLILTSNNLITCISSWHSCDFPANH